MARTFATRAVGAVPASFRRSTLAGADAYGRDEAECSSIGFVIDLIVNRQRTVRHTQVLHVTSNESEAWAAWDGRRLLEFILRTAGVVFLPTADPVAPRSGLDIPSKVPDPATTAVPERSAPPPAHRSPCEAEADAADAHRARLELWKDGERCRILDAASPFVVRVPLPVLNPEAAAGQWHVQVTVCACDAAERRLLVSASGPIEPGCERVELTVDRFTFGAGIYRFESELRVVAATENALPASSWRARSGPVNIV